MSEPRTTYDTRWYDEPVTCCSRCHFIQFEGEDSHASWCADDEPAPAGAAMRRAGVPSLFGEG